MSATPTAISSSWRKTYIGRNFRFGGGYPSTEPRTELMWNHYAFREWAATHANPAEAKFQFLDTKNNWWRQYFEDTDRSRQRQYFSGGA